MRTAVRDTSIRAYHDPVRQGIAAGQRARILGFIERGSKRDWSIGELAKAMGMEKSTVSARLNEMLASGELQERTKRMDRISGVKIRPVALPAVQGSLEL